MPVDAATGGDGVPVKQVLDRLGFRPDHTTNSEHPQALSYDFGNLVLTVGEYMNRYFTRDLLFHGNFNDGRTVALIEFNMPLMVESHAQALAWIAHGVGDWFRPSVATPWLEEGQSLTNELPWRKQMLAWERRPACSVGRDWMRPTIKRLRMLAEAAQPGATFDVSFDGSVLKIQAAGEKFAMAAVGREPWPEPFRGPLTQLVGLPRRLMFDSIDLALWQGHLEWGNRRFSASSLIPDSIQASAEDL